MDLVLTRDEIEKRLVRGIVRRNVTFTDIRNKEITGMVSRLTVEVDRHTNELMVTFRIRDLKYEVDLIYLNENLIIHNGDTRRTEHPDVWRILEAN